MMTVQSRTARPPATCEVAPLTEHPNITLAWELFLIKGKNCLCTDSVENVKYGRVFEKFVNQFLLTHFVLQTRLSHFECDVASARKRATLVLDQYFRFGVRLWE